jgi:hypothetical protein
MTAQEAQNLSHWNSVPKDIQKMIKDRVEQGEFYVTLPRKLTMDESHSLCKLGYYVFFNKAFETHEVRW